MWDKVIKLLNNTLEANKSNFTIEEIAEHKACIEFLENCKDMKYQNRRLAFRNNILQEAILQLKNGKGNENFIGDILLTRRDFVNLWSKCTENNEDGEFRYEDMVYGTNVTVHWNGFYCNCSDGATANNYIMEGINGIEEEEEEIYD